MKEVAIIRYERLMVIAVFSKGIILIFSTKPQTRYGEVDWGWVTEKEEWKQWSESFGRHKTNYCRKLLLTSISLVVVAKLYTNECSQWTVGFATNWAETTA